MSLSKTARSIWLCPAGRGLAGNMELGEIQSDRVEIQYVCAVEGNSMMADNRMQRLDDAIAVPEATLLSGREVPTEGH